MSFRKQFLYCHILLPISNNESSSKIWFLWRLLNQNTRVTNILCQRRFFLQFLNTATIRISISLTICKEAKFNQCFQKCTLAYVFDNHFGTYERTYHFHTDECIGSPILTINRKRGKRDIYDYFLTMWTYRFSILSCSQISQLELSCMQH